MLRLEVLNRENLEQYLLYLQKAMTLEPDRMTAGSFDPDGIRKRMEDPFFQRTHSLLAFDEEGVAGRIEYHFYGCLQDGYKMAYVDWVYVLPGKRHKGIARALFSGMELECRKRGINQYYLIRAVNPDADRFYKAFEDVTLQEEPLLRKELN